MMQKIALGIDIADAITGEAPLYSDPGVLTAVSNLAAALARAEGTQEADIPDTALQVRRAFAIRSQFLTETA